MTIALPTLTQALQAVGNAHLFVGDPFTLNGLGALGQKEGEMRFSRSYQYSDLTAPELTGDVVHQRTIMGVGITVTIPIILGDPLLYAKISPTGTKGGGWSNPQAVVTTSVVIFPDSEIGGGLANTDGTIASWSRTAGNGYGAAGNTSAAPKHAVWIWRAVPENEGWGYTYENGGKQITEVVFTAMFDAARPEGQKVYTQGDPIDVGITTIRI